MDGTGRREAAGLMGLTAFAKAVHSIRTRYALVTGFFLLLFLAVFYVGGRFVTLSGPHLAALAVLRRPDVFHAAVAGAPVTEWRLYDTAYTERYLGDPIVSPR